MGASGAAGGGPLHGEVPHSMRMMALSKVYQLLEPGPVVLLTTAARGAANVMTMSWHMMVEFEPPQVACVVSSANYSFAALHDRRECVIAIPSVDLASIVVRGGNTSGRNIDKFATSGLTPMPSTYVAAPLVKECFANLECKVIDMRLVTNTICLFSVYSRHGLIQLGRIARPFTTAAMASSLSMVRRLSSSRGCASSSPSSQYGRASNIA